MRVLMFQFMVKNLAVSIDDDDRDRVLSLSWHIVSAGSKKYLGHNFKSKGKRSYIHLHRFIMQAPPGTYVDHINGDTLDNRKANLRLCTNAENVRNAKKKSGVHSSAYKGVCTNKHGKWVAQITVNYKNHYLGTFETEEQAHSAYCEAATKHFGEFARFS
jgi:hypothetical protein